MALKKKREKKETLGLELQLVFAIVKEKLDLNNMPTDKTSNSRRNMCAVTPGASLCPE